MSVTKTSYFPDIFVSEISVALKFSWVARLNISLHKANQTAGMVWTRLEGTKRNWLRVNWGNGVGNLLSSCYNFSLPNPSLESLVRLHSIFLPKWPSSEVLASCPLLPPDSGSYPCAGITSFMSWGHILYVRPSTPSYYQRHVASSCYKRAFATYGRLDIAADSSSPLTSLKQTW